MIDREELDTAAVWAAVRQVAWPLAGWLLVLAGAVILTVGWFGVSREALVAKQLPYLLSGGLGGIALIFVGAVLIGSNDVRQVARRLNRLEDQVADLHAALLVEPGTRAAPAASTNGHSDAPESVVVLEGGEKFHAGDCPVVSGKEHTEQVTVEEAEERGLTACKLCDPVPAGAQRGSAGTGRT